MTNLKIELRQIYNPTDKWMSCTLGSNGSKVFVSPIPPRSTRPLPNNISRPQIINESVLQPSQIARFSALKAIVSSSIVVESIELHIQGLWHGIVHIGDISKEIESVTMINEKEITGWFVVDEVIMYFIGNLNTLSRSVTYTIYESNAIKRTDIRGSVSIDDEKYVIDGKSGDFSFSLQLEIEDAQKIQSNENITGNYVGFYEKGPNSCEIHTDLKVTTLGLATGHGIEESKQFVLFGLIDLQKNQFFFIRNKGNDIICYIGRAYLTSEIFFQGRWNMGSNSGGFTLIRFMDDGKSPPIQGTPPFWTEE